jgi:outer membrane lipoprotein carrier protein
MPPLRVRHCCLAWIVACALAGLAFASPAAAGGLDQLRAFLDGAKAGKTTFRQVVRAKGKAGGTPAAGTFTFARPGKFRWAYETPYEQLIVGDGDRLWIYDRDLNQVIVRRLDRALGASPAAILAGSNALDASFVLSDAGQADGLEFVDAQPRTPDTGFERVRIGFRDNQPRAMELADAFGNVTQLTFAAFERNVPVDAALFRFVPPKGADVVGE